MWGPALYWRSEWQSFLTATERLFYVPGRKETRIATSKVFSSSCFSFTDFPDIALVNGRASRSGGFVAGSTSRDSAICFRSWFGGRACGVLATSKNCTFPDYQSFFQPVNKVNEDYRVFRVFSHKK